VWCKTCLRTWTVFRALCWDDLREDYAVRCSALAVAVVPVSKVTIRMSSYASWRGFSTAESRARMRQGLPATARHVTAPPQTVFRRSSPSAFASASRAGFKAPGGSTYYEHAASGTSRAVEIDSTPRGSRDTWHLSEGEMNKLVATVPVVRMAPHGRAAT